jgi:hypothetical protein
MLTETLENPPAARQQLCRLALVQRIEGEYREMPVLKLTEAQAQRLATADFEANVTRMYIRAAAYHRRERDK